MRKIPGEFDNPEQPRIYQEELYTEEGYEQLKRTLLKAAMIIDKAGVMPCMVKGGFAADLLGKETVNKLGTFKAYDIDLVIDPDQVDKALEALSTAGFVKTQVLEEEGKPVKYQFLDPATHVLIDIFPDHYNLLALAQRFQVGDSTLSLQSPMSLYDNYEAEFEGRFRANMPGVNREQRRKKAQERVNILEAVIKKLNIPPVRDF